ncbi:PD-(D/E)XK nuclease family protein [Haladaptatus sp. ZSTT2]|uniref:PD-(D/E)XK nuclease family protein n=1 Tax=Haladaptatus sp. ZSTT2 TaxID=3120515 RepID=UPI00300ECC2D
MPVRRAKSIDRLYEEIRDYDLVLSTEAALTLALDRRLDHTRVGRLAATPRSHASGELIPEDRRNLFFHLLEHTNLSWKQSSYLLEQVLHSWEETGDPESISEESQFSNHPTKVVVDEVSSTDSSYRDLHEFTLPDSLDVVVIGKQFLTELDKGILPAEYDTISPFSEEMIPLPEFEVFPSATAIVDTLIENIAPDEAEEFAVVVDRSSPYSTLIESAFDAHDIPYYGGPGFIDEQSVRTFLRLLRFGFSRSGLRVADIRPIATVLGFEIEATHDEKRVQTFDHTAVNEFQKFVESLPEGTFETAVSTVEDRLGRGLPKIRAEFQHLDLLKAQVTQTAINNLQYYLQSFEVPTEEGGEGVLLVSATAAAYVDRPVVFYIGLGQGWQHTIPKKPWVSRPNKAAENIEKFQLLIQNGIEQHFLVQDTRAGEEVTPCLYFQEFADEPFESFSDRPHTVRARPKSEDSTGFEYQPLEEDIERKSIDSISQSKLNTFVNCPRDYLFTQLVDGPQYSYFQKGNLFHEFAEFYVNHPSLAENNLCEIRSHILEEMRLFIDEYRLPLMETEIEHGTQIIIDYLNENPPTQVEYPGYIKRFNDNQFATKYDVEITSTITEQWFENASLGVHGIVDLLAEPQCLLDYKSGKSKTLSSILKNARVDEISDTPNFQVALYLANHRQHFPDEELSFSFLFFLGTLDDAVRGTVSIDDILVDVPYYPVSFSEFVSKDEAYSSLVSGVSETNDRRKTLEKLGYGDFQQFFSSRQFPDVDSKDDLLETSFAAEFIAFSQARAGEYKYVEKGCNSALKKLSDIKSQTLFKPDLDAFESFLQTQLSSLEEYRESRFPVCDPNPDRLNNPDMILTNE